MHQHWWFDDLELHSDHVRFEGEYTNVDGCDMELDWLLSDDWEQIELENIAKAKVAAEKRKDSAEARRARKKDMLLELKVAELALKKKYDL